MPRFEKCPAPTPLRSTCRVPAQKTWLTSAQAVDSCGLRDLEHLYRASLKAHEADCHYHDDQLRRTVPCERHHAQQFLDAAIRFTFWLDSQA